MSQYRKRVEPEYEIPWRPVNWSTPYKESRLTKMKKFQIRTPDVNELRILLHGPVGAGKSSFINSVNSVFQGRITTIALADATAGKSFTTKLKMYRLRKDDPGSFYPFVFVDTMGLESGKSSGVHTDDIFRILRGQVKNDYTFNPICPIDKSSSSFNHHPRLTDKIHCLLSILPTDNISLISADVIQKMKHVHKMARDLRIPEVIILSKVDKACPLVANDLRKVYTSRKIREKMQECSERLGLPIHSVFPVKNYSEEIDTVLDLDVLIVKAMTNIIAKADDCVANQAYTR